MMMITSSGDEPDLRDGKDLRRQALTLQVGPQGSRGGAGRGEGGFGAERGERGVLENVVPSHAAYSVCRGCCLV